MLLLGAHLTVSNAVAPASAAATTCCWLFNTQANRYQFYRKPANMVACQPPYAPAACPNNAAPPPAPPVAGRPDTGLCSFVEGVQYSVEADSGWTDMHRHSKEECCTACGQHSGCQHFVYEATSGTCVLLPPTRAGAELVQKPNTAVVSGGLSCPPPPPMRIITPRS